MRHNIVGRKQKMDISKDTEFTFPCQQNMNTETDFTSNIRGSSEYSFLLPNKTIRSFPEYQGASTVFRTIAITLGTEIQWSVQYAFTTPLLVELGLSSGLIGFLWMIGPTLALFFLPLLGSFSDNFNKFFWS